ncbi:MAG TPA: hypothetical protein VIL28_02480 [Steroidobacteraceae bacterium]
MVGRRTSTFALALLLAFSWAHGRANTCDTACLRSHLDAYMSALPTRDPALLKLARDVRFTENGTSLSVGSGLWRTASGLGGYRHFMVDPVSQQAMFIGIVHEGGESAIATIRLKIADDAIREIEHVVARKGSHALFAPQAFVKPHPSLTTPVAQRLSRERLIEIANSYFEGIEQHDSKIIHASESCQRIENGVQTTNQSGRRSRNCAHSADLLTHIKAVRDRRFPIVDVDHGIVVATVLFDIPEGTPESVAFAGGAQATARTRELRTLLLTEWFKIDDGKTQHIEAIMHNLPHGASSGWEP